MDIYFIGIFCSIFFSWIIFYFKFVSQAAMSDIRPLFTLLLHQLYNWPDTDSYARPDTRSPKKRPDMQYKLTITVHLCLPLQRLYSKWDPETLMRGYTAKNDNKCNNNQINSSIMISASSEPQAEKSLHHGS